VKEELAVIDVTKSYPEKEIFLSEIADIAYVQLDEENEDYLFKGHILFVSKNNIIVYNGSNGDVLFFSREGKPKSKFNKKGNGPGEYNYLSVNHVLYNEEKDEFFAYINKNIHVYSSSGDHKRTIPVDPNLQVAEMTLMSDNSILLFDKTSEMNHVYGEFNKSSGDPEDASKIKELPTTYFTCISGEDGEIQHHIFLPEDFRVNLTERKDMNGMVVVIDGQMNHILTDRRGHLLHYPQTDTIFLLNKSNTLIPVMVQTPSMQVQKPVKFINTFVETRKYQFIQTTTTKAEGMRFPSTYLVREKKEGNTYLQKILFDEFKSYEISISPLTVSRCHEANEGYISLSVQKLRDAYETNKLEGKLKEFVASMDEERENDVLVFMSFK